MKSDAIVRYVFLFVGSCLLVAAFFIYQNRKEFLRTALVADGTVIDLVRKIDDDDGDVTYRPIVKFKTSGDVPVEFTSSSGSNPPSYTKGDHVEVLYQESSPRKPTINSFFALWGATSILGFVGGVLFLVGVVMLIRAKLARSKIESLKKNGVRIKAKIQGVDINESIELNGMNPFQIRAQWLDPETSELYVFKNDNIWFDPTDHISTEDVTVLIQKNNPKKYHVDTSFLPELAN